MVNSGLITIVSFISPFRSERKLVRDLVDKGEFVEVFIDTPLKIAEKRDPKGLYKKARSENCQILLGLIVLMKFHKNPKLS